MYRGIASFLTAAALAAPSLAGDGQPSLRFASYNAFLNRSAAGDLVAELGTTDSPQVQAVAEVIQRLRPAVVLLNEFDYDEAGAAAQLFQENYLSISQNGANPIDYPHVFAAPSNTGVPSGFDLNNDGVAVTDPADPGYADDCFGFGFFPGQYGMIVLSRYPIAESRVRTFQHFLWKDMPGALLPDDPDTPEPADFYTAEELDVLRLSSKSHWDVPIMLGNQLVHLLCAHPTPPIFDGPEDKNGTRNFDEIRFWADYITPGAADYIYDDNGHYGGLRDTDRFVIVGDYNADPYDGDGIPGAMAQLLEHPRVTDSCPVSLGGFEASLRQEGANTDQAGNPSFDTGDFTDESPFFDPSGNLRVDYALPSSNMGVVSAGVAWPAEGEPFFDLVGAGNPADGSDVISSDHRMVWVRVTPFPVDEPAEPFGEIELEFLGEATLPTGTLFEETEVGGLSALVYDPTIDLYLALSDDRSSINPARYYTLELDLADGELTEDDLALRDVVTLLQPSGDAYGENALDPEGLALAKTGELYLSSEGDAGAGIDPFVNQFGVAGTQIAELAVPFKFLVGQDVGVRTNLAFESLTLGDDDTALYTATENALFQDGPTASLDGGSPCRILAYDLSSGDAAAEYLYWTEAIAHPTLPAGEFATNGLVELLAIEESRLLALERSFSVGVGNTIRLFDASLEEADNVASVAALDGVVDRYVAVSKTLVLDLDDLGITLDNVEGMTFGPVLPDGRRTLVLVSDNNFNPTQFTQFLAFAIE